MPKLDEKLTKIENTIRAEKLYLENRNLNNSIESLQENQNAGKEQHNQLKKNF